MRGLKRDLETDRAKPEISNKRSRRQPVGDEVKKKVESALIFWGSSRDRLTDPVTSDVIFSGAKIICNGGHMSTDESYKQLKAQNGPCPKCTESLLPQVVSDFVTTQLLKSI